MVRYASRAPSVDHQWASYVSRISSVSKAAAVVITLVFVGFHSLVSMETDSRLTFIGPIGEAIRHMLLLIGAGEAQRFAGHARLVEDISVEHVGLARAAETDGANFIITGGSGRRRIERKTPRKTEPDRGHCFLLHKLMFEDEHQQSSKKSLRVKTEQMNYENKSLQQTELMRGSYSTVSVHSRFHSKPC